MRHVKSLLFILWMGAILCLEGCAVLRSFGQGLIAPYTQYVGRIARGESMDPYVNAARERRPETPETPLPASNAGYEPELPASVAAAQNQGGTGSMVEFVHVGGVWDPVLESVDRCREPPCGQPHVGHSLQRGYRDKIEVAQALIRRQTTITTAWNWEQVRRAALDIGGVTSESIVPHDLRRPLVWNGDPRLLQLPAQDGALPWDRIFVSYHHTEANYYFRVQAFVLTDAALAEAIVFAATHEAVMYEAQRMTGTTAQRLDETVASCNLVQLVMVADVLSLYNAQMWRGENAALYTDESIEALDALNRSRSNLQDQSIYVRRARMYRRNVAADLNNRAGGCQAPMMDGPNGTRVPFDALTIAPDLLARLLRDS